MNTQLSQHYLLKTPHLAVWGPSLKIRYRFMSFVKFQKFSAIISLSIFRPTFFLFSFQDPYDMNIRSLVSHLTLRNSAHFILIYFLSIVRLDNFYLSIYRFTNSFLVLLHCVVKLIHLVFCWCCSVTKSHMTLCDPTDCSMPGLPVLHHLPEFPQIHVH